MGRKRNRSLEALLDRVEDRLVDAPIGLHQVGGPGSAEAVAALLASGEGMSEEAVALWRRWDGLDLGNGEARILACAELEAAQARADGEGILQAGDVVIGEIGRILLVVPADPWEEGAEVVMVEDDGERSPYASSVAKLALALVAEMALLYDDEGEYREGLFEEHGELNERSERRLLRRRLDFDEDAPFPRFRLGQLLRRAREFRAARSELRRVLHCAPSFAWAHWELGRACLAMVEAEDEAGCRDAREREGVRGEASEAFATAAEHAGDPHLAALFLAWQARSCDPSVDAGKLGKQARGRLAAQVLERDPGFVAAREQGLREAIEHEDRHRAQELLELGLSVEPRHLGLLGLRSAVESLPWTFDDDDDDA